MKKTFLIILLMIPLLSLQAQTVERDTIRMTLEDCLEYAFGYNYQRQSVKINEEAQEDIYEQTKMERWPSLSASLSESLSHTQGTKSSYDGNYGLNTSVTLYEGGKIGNTIKKEELGLKKAGYESLQYDNELTIQILQTFLTALGNEELLRLQAYLVTVSEEQEREGKLKYESGQMIESDYLLLKAQLATNKKDMLQSEINRDNSLMSLKSLLSMDPLLKFAIIPPNDNIDSLRFILPELEFMERAMNTLPDLKISEYLVEMAEVGIKISKSGYYSTLALNAGIGTGHSRNYEHFGDQLSDRFNQQVGVSLSIPIFDKKRTKSNVNQSKFSLQQAQFSQKQTELDLRQTLAQEYRNVIAAESTYDASDIKRNAYYESFNAYNVMFREGAITTVDLLQQQNNYISAMNEYIQDKYNFILKRKIVDVYLGEPITM